MFESKDEETIILLIDEIKTPDELVLIHKLGGTTFFIHTPFTANYSHRCFYYCKYLLDLSYPIWFVVANIFYFSNIDLKYMKKVKPTPMKYKENEFSTEKVSALCTFLGFKLFLDLSKEEMGKTLEAHQNNNSKSRPNNICIYIILNLVQASWELELLRIYILEQWIKKTFMFWI